MRGVQCGGYGIKLTDFVSQSTPNGQMVSKARRGTPSSHSSTRERARRGHRPKSPATVTATQHHEARNDFDAIELSLSQRTNASSSVAPSYHFSDGDSLLPGSKVHENVNFDVLQGPKEMNVCDPQRSHTSSGGEHELPVPGAMFDPNFDWNPDTSRDQEDWMEGPCSPENSFITGIQDLSSSSQSINASLWSNVEAFFTSGGLGLVPMDEPTVLSSTETVSYSRSGSASETCPEEESLVVDQRMRLFLKDPVLRPPPSDPFDQYLFSHCEILSLSSFNEHCRTQMG